MKRFLAFTMTSRWVVLVGLLGLALVPSSARAQGAGGQVVVCNNWVQASVAVGTTQMIAGVPAVTNAQGQITQQGKSISICGVVFSSTGAATGQLVSGTGTNCSTGQAPVGLVWNISAAQSTGLLSGNATVTLPSGASLCATIGTTTTSVQVIYTQN